MKEHNIVKVAGILFGVVVVILFITLKAHASQVTIPTTWHSGDTVTDTKLNNINNAFANVINGGLDSTNTASGYSFIHSVSALPSAGTQGTVDFLTSDNSLNIDNGAAWAKVITPADTLATGQIPYYNSGWHQLSPGSQYLPIISNGASSLPSYQTLSAHGGGTNADLSAAAQGAVPYFSATGTMSALAVGTSGQYLQSQGAAANPQWATLPGSQSNALFQYQGQIDFSTTSKGEYVGTSLTPTPAATYRFLVLKPSSVGAYEQVLESKFTKISGISTVTVYYRIWENDASKNANFKLDIGGLSSSSAATTTTTPTWGSITLDVSSLTNNTVYDAKFYLTNSDTNTVTYCSNIIGFGS